MCLPNASSEEIHDLLNLREEDCMRKDKSNETEELLIHPRTLEVFRGGMHGECIGRLIDMDFLKELKEIKSPPELEEELGTEIIPIKYLGPVDECDRCELGPVYRYVTMRGPQWVISICGEDGCGFVWQEVLRTVH